MVVRSSGQQAQWDGVWCVRGHTRPKLLTKACTELCDQSSSGGGGGGDVLQACLHASLQNNLPLQPCGSSATTAISPIALHMKRRRTTRGLPPAPRTRATHRRHPAWPLVGTHNCFLWSNYKDEVGMSLGCVMKGITFLLIAFRAAHTRGTRHPAWPLGEHTVAGIVSG